MEMSVLKKDFQELTGFQVNESDLPQKICKGCATNLIRLKQFINLCRITEEYLEKFRVESSEPENEKNVSKIDSQRIQFFGTVPNETNEKRIEEPVNKISNFELQLIYQKAAKLNKIVCKVCHKIISRDYLSEHTRLYHTPRQKYQCDICKKMIGIKSNLVKHIKMAHLGIKIIQKRKKKSNEKNNVNEIIYLEEPVLRNFEEHFQKYDEDPYDDNNYFEEFVPVTVEEPVLMKVEEPISLETPEPIKNKVRCDICHSEVTQPYLRKHMAYFHTDRQTHKCKICKKQFNIRECEDAAMEMSVMSKDFQELTGFQVT
uniref:CSON007067 protein n=1 Tax=Culicoides sonorensis TaxID=179676 RepID=A0A336M2J6_CULSO